MQVTPKFAIPLMVVLLAVSGFTEKAELDVLRKALEKALGNETNYGSKRILNLEEAVPRGEETLFVSIHANRQLTVAGVRHGALNDVASVLRVARSWGWAEKVQRIVILESLTLKGEEAPRPLFSCSVSASTLAEVDWTNLNSKDILKRLERAQFFELKE